MKAKKLLSALLALVMVFTLTMPALAAGEAADEIVVLYTNDVHTYINNDGIRYSTVAALKDTYQNALLVDAGYGVENVEYRLCNGLASIRPEEVDTISIAGMGGETIAAILEAAPWTKHERYTLLLSPHTKSEILREWLANNGYRIRREALIDDRNTLYPVMEVEKGEMTLSLGQIWGGAKLLHDPAGDRYLIQRIVRLQGAVAGANRSSTEADREKADQTREVITALLGMREEYRHVNGT